jgi:hypothetical protein
MDPATEPAEKSVLIPGRFNGPPASANGGYTCGAAATLLGPRPAEVMLRRPPPLDTPMGAEREDGRIKLIEGGELVAEAAPIASVDVEVPEPVSPPLAHEASTRFPWREDHPFPTCFVCGPRRPDHDGLDLFAGSVEGREEFACEWTPAAEWDRGDGAVRPEIVWAALDCPSAVGAAALVPGDPRPAVLAQLAASLERPPAIEEPHAVIAWPIDRDGRKRWAGTAIIDSDGHVCARARALWIELKT